MRLAHRDHELEELIAQGGRDAADHPEVEQGDTPVVGQEDVAGVRVRMEEAVHEDLLQVRPEELLGQAAAVDVDPGERAERRDLGARDEVHRQDPGRGVVVDRLRDDDPLEVLERLAEGDHVLGLLAVVELAQERLAKLLDHALDVEALAHLGVSREHLRDLAEGLEVLDDLLADRRPLDLHRHGTAVPQRRPMHLSERGRRDRFPVEARERLGDPHSQLGLDDLLDLLVGERLDLVLQTAEGVEVGGGRMSPRVERSCPSLTNVGPRRSRSAASSAAFGSALSERCAPAGGSETGASGSDAQLDAPVLQHEARDVLVALQMSSASARSTCRTSCVTRMKLSEDIFARGQVKGVEGRRVPSAVKARLSPGVPTPNGSADGGEGLEKPCSAGLPGRAFPRSDGATLPSMTPRHSLHPPGSAPHGLSYVGPHRHRGTDRNFPPLGRLVMKWTGMYLLGYVILIGGLLAALWKLGVLASIGTTWTLIGVVIAIGIGIMIAVSSSGSKQNIEIDRK